MKFNYKSRKGFTLIELLVVIGILAVLAAIAIPSVAGLIDRANVSSDETNANEMTNAIERFASEYELYVQDIGSGALNPNDLDSAQGRVYNVTGATTRGDITAIEKAQTVKVADVGDEVAIYRDTKYPVNNATFHKIVENYMKTSSSTFEPKQSDCNYYYSPDCGIVVCTETDKAEVTDLNALIVSGKDAKGKELGPQTQWINITESTSASNEENSIHNNIIPTGGIYITGLTGGDADNWNYEAENVFRAGDNFPSTVNPYDVYIYGDYAYMFAAHFGSGCPWSIVIDGRDYEGFYTQSLDNSGWVVGVSSKYNNTKQTYGSILKEINNKPVTNMEFSFYACSNITTVPTIHENIKILSNTFNALGMGSNTSITGQIRIDSNPIEYTNCFKGIDFKTQKITLTGNSSILDAIGSTGYNYCNDCNGYCELGHTLINPK